MARSNLVLGLTVTVDKFRAAVIDVPTNLPGADTDLTVRTLVTIVKAAK